MRVRIFFSPSVIDECVLHVWTVVSSVFFFFFPYCPSEVCVPSSACVCVFVLSSVPCAVPRRSRAHRLLAFGTTGGKRGRRFGSWPQLVFNKKRRQHRPLFLECGTVASGWKLSFPLAMARGTVPPTLVLQAL